MIDLIIMLLTLAGFVPASSAGINAYGITYCASPSGTVPLSATALPSCACTPCHWNPGGTPSFLGETDAFAGTGGSPGTLQYTASAVANSDSTTVPDGANCPAATSYAGTKPSGKNKPLSIASDTGNNCDSLRFKIYNYQGAGQWQQCYDTTMKFIETCYDNYWAPAMFQEFNAARQSLEGTDSTFWLQSQLWLQSVLYLNTTNPEYFCACVEAMQVAPPTDTGEVQGWIDLNKGLAVLRWLIQNTTCDTPTLQNEFDGARASQYSSWLNDTTVPLDTTIPSLASLGLGLDTLLARHTLYASVSNPPQPGIISSATANPNPTGAGTLISFSIAKEAYVKIELFDVLGHEASSYGYESLFEPGNKSVPLSLQGLPSGTYFARILTAYGEVQSVKLVKE
jgi:hypothetical protein